METKDDQLEGRALDAALHRELFGEEVLFDEEAFTCAYRGEIDGRRSWIAVPSYAARQEVWAVLQKMQEQSLHVQRRFGEELRSAVCERVCVASGHRMSWPETLLHMEPTDLCKAALGAINHFK